MHRGTGALGADAEPPVRRPRVLVQEREPVVRENVWHLVVVHQGPYIAVVVHVRLEKVQRAVVLLVPEVVGVVLELHPELLALVVFRHLEWHMAEAFFHRVDGPAVHCGPIRAAALHDDGLVGGGHVLQKPLWRDVGAPDPPDRSRLLVVNDWPRQHLIAPGVAELAPFGGLDVTAFALLAPPDFPACPTVLELHCAQALRRRGHRGLRGPRALLALPLGRLRGRPRAAAARHRRAF
mmetsp:Transcript_11923/g.32237  ORF Transcript_11923/g.32237 Transcript_11923/m.32237 type:complete len:237 (-) Transcript_11923:105-815(-)